jgi:hypothetical protein
MPDLEVSTDVMAALIEVSDSIDFHPREKG